MRSDSSPRMKLDGIKIENPFALKVGQVFTGFGVGCGVGIGVGRPLNLGAIPALQQIMSATRGATDAFSGVGGHVNSTLRRLGAKNIEAGIGCGVGFGHGFGVGLALKPGVVHRLQSFLGQELAKLMVKFGTVPGLSVGQDMLPQSLQNRISTMSGTFLQNPTKNIFQLISKTPESTSKETPLEASHGSRSEKVIKSFLHNPILKNEETEINELAGRLRSENNVLQMVLKHQEVIEELMQENDKLRQILVEELKVPPSKLQVRRIHKDISNTPCSDCFECRRRQRKLR
ncbi:hypothetical protein GIB67_021576 [Kingdonia uniflora]|uniref:Uncharacterized protein n=1 Tax=Kingdonia uniflora TaxID=39325 RepID=A0A7J7MDM8_9MAGN|nr:hypothetical protein GIB67_021576 [Kingdonia uniflora]